MKVKPKCSADGKIRPLNLIDNWSILLPKKKSASLWNELNLADEIPGHYISKLCEVTHIHKIPYEQNAKLCVAST